MSLAPAAVARSTSVVVWINRRQVRQKRGIIVQTSQTNWAAIDAMADEDIDLSDSPEVTPEQFSKAIVRRNLKPVTGNPIGADISPDSLRANNDH